MNTIFEGQNLGNIKSIQLIALDNLQVIPTPVNGEIRYSGLVIKQGCAFQDVYFTPETGSYVEQDEKTGAGILWKKEINFQIPKIRSEIIAELKNYENRRNAALVTDMNGTSFFVFPVRISRKKQIPGQILSINATMVNLSGQSNVESPVITELPQE